MGKNDFLTPKAVSHTQLLQSLSAAATAWAHVHVDMSACRQHDFTTSISRCTTPLRNIQQLRCQLWHATAPAPCPTISCRHHRLLPVTACHLSQQIANRIKAKGLQKLRWYCQLCQKQCRDENGFKCHQMSEGHRRQMEVFGQNPDRVVDGFSEEFEGAFLDHLRRA